MKNQRNFNAEGITHVYDISKDGGIVFYSVFDRLVFFSIFCHFAKRYKIKLLAVCIMFNHFHLLCNADHRDSIASFIQTSLSVFTRMYNKRAGRSGQLFKDEYGRSVKLGSKRIRTIIAYVYNNHTEKKLCRRAEEYRWNFLAYSISEHPYSRHLGTRETSFMFKKAKALLFNTIERQGYLNYTMLENTFESIGKEEADLLVDLLIARCSSIDFEALSSYYKSKAEMVEAINMTSGSEYDIHEPIGVKDDRPFKALCKQIKAFGYSLTSKSFLSSSQEEREMLAFALRSEIACQQEHISAFLHL